MGFVAENKIRTIKEFSKIAPQELIEVPLATHVLMIGFFTAGNPRIRFIFCLEYNPEFL